MCATTLSCIKILCFVDPVLGCALLMVFIFTRIEDLRGEVSWLLEPRSSMKSHPTTNLTQDTLLGETQEGGCPCLGKRQQGIKKTGLHSLVCRSLHTERERRGERRGGEEERRVEFSWVAIGGISSP